MTGDKSDLINYRLKRADETIAEIDDLVKLGYNHTAINRIYYGCFYAISALLLKHGIQAQTHAGVRQMLGLHFTKKGLVSKELNRFYNILFDKRHTGDYDDFIEVDENTVAELLPPAKELIKRIKELIEM